MGNVVNFYMDDSGMRHPDHDPGKRAEHNFDWFALGGILLLEFAAKMKSSPMVQFADLYLWPVCMGGYNAGNRPYSRLKQDGKLIECVMPNEDWPLLATKYYCFDEKEGSASETKNPADSGRG
jgi:hypothetical protein